MRNVRGQVLCLENNVTKLDSHHSDQVSNMSENNVEKTLRYF